MSTATLYLRVPPELHHALVQEAAARSGPYGRPNMQRVCIEMLTDRLRQLEAERAPKAKAKRPPSSTRPRS